MERLASPDEIRARQRWFMAHSHQVADNGYVLNEGVSWKDFSYGPTSIDNTIPFGVAGGAEEGRMPTHTVCSKCPVAITLPCPAVTIGQLYNEITTAPKQPYQRDTAYHVRRELAHAKVLGCLPPSQWHL